MRPARLIGVFAPELLFFCKIWDILEKSCNFLRCFTSIHIGVKRNGVFTRRFLEKLGLRMQVVYEKAIMRHHPPSRGRYLPGRPFLLLERRIGRTISVCENSTYQIWFAAGGGISGGRARGYGRLRAGHGGAFADLGNPFDRSGFGRYPVVDSVVFP